MRSTCVIFAATTATGFYPRDICNMTEQRFTVARHLLETRDWDFFVMVEIGVDRIHHAFWRWTDPQSSEVRGRSSIPERYP